MSYQVVGMAPLAILLLISAVGCNDTRNAETLEAANLRSIVSLYNYATSMNGRPPASKQEFKQFVATHGTPIMERLQIASPDELFVSERDGEPLVIVYGRRPEGMSPDVVAYESTGVGGKREVGLVLGMVKEVDETEFRELVPLSAVAP